MEKLKLTNVEVVFASLKDEGFGTSLTLKVTPEMEKEITAFWKKNNIGNDKTVIGVPSIKDYEGTKQINLKINDKTAFAGVNGLSKDDLGFGCRINCFVNAFEYNNKFTKGKTYVGASISAVVVTEGRKTGADADLSDLLNEVNGESSLPPSEKFVDEKVNDLPFN